MSAQKILAEIIKSNYPYEWPKYLFRAVQWQVRKRLGHQFRVRLDNGALMKVYPSSSYSGIFYSRFPEGDDLKFIRIKSYLANTFVDVGANVGVFSAQLFDKFDRFVCFEPAPASFMALSETFALNPQVKCELYNMAVGSEEGIMNFHIDYDLSCANRIVADPGEKTIPVKVDTLDHILGSNKYRQIIMKIDVEGQEENVFLGAEGIFRKEIVKLVMFERLGRTNLDKINAFLESNNYTIFRVLDGIKLTTDKALLYEPLINLFACPSSLYVDFCRESGLPNRPHSRHARA